jgi:hypothetical protein
VRRPAEPGASSENVRLNLAEPAGLHSRGGSGTKGKRNEKNIALDEKTA